MLGGLDRRTVREAVVRRLFDRRRAAPGPSLSPVTRATGRSRADPVRALPLRSPLAYPNSWAARDVARRRVRAWSTRWVHLQEAMLARG